MDITRLRSFCKVYELRSFSKAATHLFISQPTVSSHILSLEQELEERLFDRIGKSIIPTLAGNIVYSYAKKVLDLLYQAELEIKLLKNEVVGNLKIGGSTIPGCYILPEIISSYVNCYPQVDVVLEIYDSQEVVQMILNGSLDIGMVGAVFETEGLHFEKVISDTLVFIGHSTYLNKIHVPEDIKKVPWIMREKGSGTRKAVEMGLKKYGIDVGELDIKATVTTTQGLLSLVRAGMGISVTSKFAGSQFLKQKNIVIKKYPFFTFERDFYLVYNKERSIYPVSQIFIDFLYKSLEKNKQRYVSDGRVIK